MSTATTRAMLRCSSCGGSVDEPWAEHQNAELDLTEGTVCRECARSVVHLGGTETAIELMADALNDENAAEFDAMSRGEQAEVAFVMMRKGVISGGSPGLLLSLQKFVLLRVFEGDEGGA